MPVEITCKNCESSYSVIPSRSDSSSFCSMDCKSEYQSENMTGESNPSWSGGHMTESECEFCGDVHEHREDRLGRFCSRECKDNNRKNLTGEDATAWKGGPDEKVCDFCNDTYSVKQSRSDESKFCSKGCMALWRSENWRGTNCPNWEGGHQKSYGPMWNSIREDVRDRDGCCQLCGMTIEKHKNEYGRNPDVHHIKPIKSFDSFKEANKMSNLIMLCRDCHSKVEAGKKKIESVEPDE